MIFLVKLGVELRHVLSIVFKLSAVKYKTFHQNMKARMMMKMIIATLKSKKMSETTKKVSEFFILKRFF